MIVFSLICNECDYKDMETILGRLMIYGLSGCVTGERRIAKYS